MICFRFDARWGPEERRVCARAFAANKRRVVRVGPPAAAVDSLLAPATEVACVRMRASGDQSLCAP